MTNSLLDPNLVLKEAVNLVTTSNQDNNLLYERIIVELRWKLWNRRGRFRRILDWILRTPAPPEPKPLGEWRIVVPKSFLVGAKRDD